MTARADFAVVGAGPAGLMMALLLARRGHVVDVFERRADPRSGMPEAGRSINLALAARGLAALEEAGLRERLAPLLVPMAGRTVHEPGRAPGFVPYGQRGEAIHSVSRARLTLELTHAAAAQERIRLHFDHRCTGLDEAGRARLLSASGGSFTAAAPRCIAADGAGSAVRDALAARGLVQVREEPLAHDYKELEIAPDVARGKLDPNSLHIWPRGGFMLIALPNADGSFTATLFLARTGERSFERLVDDDAVEAFFRAEFPDALELVPDLAAQFARHPQGRLGTVYTRPFNHGEDLLLIGDAAHAIVPFHGQGMNCALEDCRLLAALLDAGERAPFATFAATRPVDTDAIALMALENYGEMRDTVRDPRFLAQKALSLELERRHPRRFVPRYSMVMFRADIPYSVALERGRVQQEILDALVPDGDARPDLDTADRLVLARLAPLPRDALSAPRGGDPA